METEVLLKGLEIGGKVVGGAASAASSIYHATGPGIDRGGSTGNPAAISPQLTPFIRIIRKKGYYPGDIEKQIGLPSYEQVRLGSLKGFTRVSFAHLQIATTEEENNELIELLKRGVIL